MSMRLCLIAALVALGLGHPSAAAAEGSSPSVLTRLVLGDAVGVAKMADAQLSDLYYLAGVTIHLDRNCPLTDRSAIAKAGSLARAVDGFRASLTGDNLMAMMLSNAHDRNMAIYLSFYEGSADLDRLIESQTCATPVVKQLHGTLQRVWAMFVQRSK